MISSTQMRAARAMLNVSQGEVAKALGIAANTLSNIENEQSDAPVSRLKEIQNYYEAQGLEFTPDDGVKRSSHPLQIYQGQEGFHAFYDDLYNIARTEGGCFCVNNVSENVFDKWHGNPEKLQRHLERMAKVIRNDPNFNMRIIIREGDYNFRATQYARYRWAHKDRFSDISFYVYGGKLAILIFEDNDVYITVIPNRRVADAYRQQFDLAWEAAYDPPIQ